MIEVKRPDLRKPNLFQISLDETMLDWLENGTLKQLHVLQQDLLRHGECDLRNPHGCRVRFDWLVNTYGSIDDAVAQGHYPTDCSADLSFLHHSMASLHDFLTQSRYVRTRNDSHGINEVREAERQLDEIKGEVTAREVSARNDTTTFEAVKDDSDSAPEDRRAGLGDAARQKIQEAADKIRQRI